MLSTQWFHSLYVILWHSAGVPDHHAAEELASQVFEEGIRDIKRFQYRGVPVRAWLFGIAHHVCADYLTKSRRVQTTSVQDVLDRHDALEERWHPYGLPACAGATDRRAAAGDRVAFRA